MKNNQKTVQLIGLIVLGLFFVLGCHLVVPPTPTPQPATPTLEPTMAAPTAAASTPALTATPTVTPRDTATTEPTEPPPTPTPTETATIETDTPAANELRLFSYSDPETLDPALVQDSTSHQFVSLIFSGLVTLDSDLQVIPDLASSWDIDETGTIYTFHLRPEARFHNGDPVTAEDVVYSIDRACDPDRGSVQRAQSYLDDIVGVMERTRGQADEIAGLAIIDDHTVQITIDAPKPYFLAKLTYPTSYVVNRANVTETRGIWTAHPVGTGPFFLAENGINQMVLGAFDDYYLGRPTVDQLIFSYRGQPVNLYERDELDVIQVPADYIDRVLDPSDPLNQDLVVVSQADVWYIGFNTSMPPFDDRNVRRAFALATNKRAIAEIAYNKTVLPANGILPPGMPGYNPDLEGLDFDADAALNEIYESIYGDVTELPPITLTVTGSGTGEMLAEMYRQILGVEIEVQVMDWGPFLGALDNQELQMFSLGWIADYPDPQNFLDMLFHSNSAYNHGAYSNPELDAIVEQARVEQDVEARMALYQQAEYLLVQDAPWIPLYHSGGYYLVKPRVQGLSISAQETMNLHEVSIID
jgi:ABC-type transport system substrate-binding protein